jgi:DTW domain-containing protein YfiP
MLIQEVCAAKWLHGKYCRHCAVEITMHSRCLCAWVPRMIYTRRLTIMFRFWNPHLLECEIFDT